MIVFYRVMGENAPRVSIEGVVEIPRTGDSVDLGDTFRRPVVDVAWTIIEGAAPRATVWLGSIGPDTRGTNGEQK